MIKRACILLISLCLAGCGVDGEPERPAVAGSIGISSSGNVYSNVGVGVRQGPFSIFVGL